MMMLAKPQPTAEQQAILNAVRTTGSNLQIRALAGTGKTSTLEMIEESIHGPVLCLAFNKRIAEEMEKRFKSTTTVRTFNSLGHRIWARANAANLSFDPKKSNKLLTEIIKETKEGFLHPLDRAKKPLRPKIWENYWEILNIANMAKAIGYIPDGVFPNARRLCDRKALINSLEETPSSSTLNLVDKLLVRSIRTAYEGYVDYNDQIYMPALFGGTFPKFPLVMVDEKQDLNPTNYAMLQKLRGSRIISVGDPYQSIYAFRGAMAHCMDRAKTEFSMEQFDLSISFRCPQAIVENARWRVPWFKWNREGGYVKRLYNLATVDIADEAAVICRNNAPLFRLAFSLLTSGRSVRVAGSDIGPKHIGILRRLGSEDMARSAVLSAISAWQAEREDKGSTTAADMAAAMRVFAEHGENLRQAISYAELLFKQQGSIQLLTGHKAKGLEFNTVYHLDPWLIRDGEQEDNLRYVIDTRARERLYYINSKDIQ